MKNFVLFSAIILVAISCSKENLDKKEDQPSISSAELKSAVITPNADSIARMNAGAFLKSNLTAQEIDSIIKINAKAFSKFTSKSAPTFGPSYTDWSGKIHLQIFSLTAYGQHPHVEVEISADYVLVGGGAEVLNWNPFDFNLAFITESRPNESLTTWIGSSKDHIYTDYHSLTVYAIGMKIDGITPEFLRSKMKVFSAKSPKENHPTISVPIPSNYLLIGGGAFDDYQGYGNMLVTSYPASRFVIIGGITLQEWTVSGKDHRRPDPSIITAYAIGIENISFPNVGYIQTEFSCYMSNRNYGYFRTDVTIPTDWALTCCGGKVTYEDEGRMIMENYPVNSSTVRLASGQHTYLDYGVNYPYLVRIQKTR